MSLAFERIELSGLGSVVACGSASIFEPVIHTERRIGEDEPECCNSSSTSSIGRNSDSEGDRSSEDENCDENEAESSYRGPLDMMDSLEEVLPSRKGISKFCNGKSKSFTNLDEASSASSIKDIVKPENAYSRRRRNLLAINHFWDKNRNISKRPSRSSLALAVAMTESGIISRSGSSSGSNDSDSRSPSRLPPLYPQSRASSHGNFSSSSPPRKTFATWRSFSVADLPQCVITSNSKT
ncbi:uncharacterized protein LOC110809261 [Carica papaya]|uniref:uncharacterized protein LOC110809261 n=1 Tax=Carica papaya TaxID=3649 RepID=UPI000B8CA0E7|nr:uncharacterized protein LOC110809261 [Carica papaya]